MPTRCVVSNNQFAHGPPSVAHSFLVELSKCANCTYWVCYLILTQSALAACLYYAWGYSISLVYVAKQVGMVAIAPPKLVLSSTKMSLPSLAPSDPHVGGSRRFVQNSDQFRVSLIWVGRIQELQLENHQDSFHLGPPI